MFQLTTNNIFELSTKKLLRYLITSIFELQISKKKSRLYNKIL